MQRKNGPPLRRRAITAIPAGEQDGIFLDLELATKLLAAEGANTHRARAEELGLALSAVHRLWTTTAPVSDDVIYAFRVRFPRVRYERLFKERQGVRSDGHTATARAAA